MLEEESKSIIMAVVYSLKGYVSGMSTSQGHGTECEGSTVKLCNEQVSSRWREPQ